ncbi:UrcA family protein [Brevundimonas lenta]|uniref:UrcA family protein n=1 Tax=Brevundimonas lenta TaxID=424796 RepID=A0A7W6JCC6_9CAUL|nr:UrcA family protein [Brevundimonas lenta]MBB4082536.1 UrcA family protein [Brevundimonas lenta]
MTGISRALAVVAVSTLALAASSAQSQTYPDQTTRIAPVEVLRDSVRIQYGDLDLATVAGRDAMDARIHRASFHVCQVNRQPLVQQFDRLQCVNEARRGANQQLANNMARSYAQNERVLVMAIAH